MAGADAARPLHAALPQVEPQAARALNAVLRALNGGGEGLSAQAAPASTNPVLRFSAGLGLRPLAADAAPCAWTATTASPALPEALVELSRLEPLIAAMERALGEPLEPEALESPPPGAHHVRVEVRDGREVRFAAVAAFDAGYVPSAPEAATVVRLGPAARARTAARLVVQGPKAPARELRLLGVGDLVLVPCRADALAAEVSCGARRVAGAWSPALGRFSGEVGGEVGMDGVTDGEALAAGTALEGDIPVRLSVELAAFELPLAEVAALAPGAVLAVPVQGDAPAVRITSGGAPVASGRLVALGEGYAVLVETVELKPADPAA